MEEKARPEKKQPYYGSFRSEWGAKGVAAVVEKDDKQNGARQRNYLAEGVKITTRNLNPTEPQTRNQPGGGERGKNTSELPPVGDNIIESQVPETPSFQGAGGKEKKQGDGSAMVGTADDADTPIPMILGEDNGEHNDGTKPPQSRDERNFTSSQIPFIDSNRNPCILGDITNVQVNKDPMAKGSMISATEKIEGWTTTTYSQMGQNVNGPTRFKWKREARSKRVRQEGQGSSILGEKRSIEDKENEGCSAQQHAKKGQVVYSTTSAGVANDHPCRQQ